MPLLKLLLAVGIVLALAAGGWALFLRSTDDPGKTLTIGALEDGVKYSDQTLAEKQVAFAKQADLDALNITTAWTPGQTEPDPGELALLRGVADAAQKAGIQLLITAYAAKPSFAPTTDEQQDNYAQYMANLARSLPSVDAFAVWNEPNLNGFWLDQFDESGNDIAATAYEALLAKTYDALKAVSPKLKVYGGNLAPRGFDDADSSRPTHSPTAVHQGPGHRVSAERPHEADHGRLRAAPIPDPLVDPARSAAHRNLPRYRRLRQARLTARRSLRRHGPRGLEAPGRVHGVRRPVDHPAERAGPVHEPRSRRSARTPYREDTQADYYRQAFELAACQPTVIAVYIFHLFDEADLNRWQSGPYYTDTKPKSSLDAISKAAKKAREGKLADCS